MSSELLESSSHSRRPKDSSFFQQRLPAWQPMFTAKKSAATFIVLGIVFIPIGVVLLVTSNNVTEYVVDYTDCTNPGGNKTCAEQLSLNLPCECVITVEITTDIPGPVYFYYGLKNFYQNHRRYGRSKSDTQLLGRKVDPSSLSSCSPYASVTTGDTTKAILPCGAIANSIFNDTFSLSLISRSGSTTPVPVTNKGIAWQSDIDRKYGTLTNETVTDTVKPPNWNLTELERSPGAFKTDEELMVWMRVAALPNFRKLHRRILQEGDFSRGLPAGTYTINVAYNFPVTGFGGKKSFIIGNVSWLGGKNNTLGVTCIVTGALHLILGIAFLVVHIYSSRR
ncbi:unnamed protein product [Echinostoma caproni]|uniref:Cell cycle control protein 50A n=1 Tax=Echinostoma caproni TaxID=27848 RepID=A0A183AZA3_9TREM|nr:unnamed protein product [Echinostoma caproni]